MDEIEDKQALNMEEAARLDNELTRFKRRLLVYVSGKYSDRDEWSVDCNIHYAKLVAVQLWDMGYAVLCPHANAGRMGFGADVFLEGDMVMLERSDLVVMLPNWESSHGAKLEHHLALKLGIPVYYWGCGQLDLMRLATDEPSCRGARACMLHRADRLAQVTGYHPQFSRAG